MVFCSSNNPPPSTTSSLNIIIHYFLHRRKRHLSANGAYEQREIYQAKLIIRLDGLYNNYGRWFLPSPFAYKLKSLKEGQRLGSTALQQHCSFRIVVSPSLSQENFDYSYFYCLLFLCIVCVFISLYIFRFYRRLVSDDYDGDDDDGDESKRVTRKRQLF